MTDGPTPIRADADTADTARHAPARLAPARLATDPDPVPEPAPSSLCPSAPPDRPDSVVFGVVVGAPGERRVGYLNQLRVADAEVLALAGPAKPAEVFRTASACAGRGCKHFDGANCSLVQRIVERLPAVVAGLPPCRIRPICMWWRQEGKAACLRCPQVVTEVRNATEEQRRIADAQA